MKNLLVVSAILVMGVWSYADQVVCRVSGLTPNDLNVSVELNKRMGSKIIYSTNVGAYHINFDRPYDDKRGFALTLYYTEGNEALAAATSSGNYVALRRIDNGKPINVACRLRWTIIY